jgi:DNA-binding FadR family transcriptional regulator
MTRAVAVNAPARRSRTAVLVSALEAQIREDHLLAGDRLPTEAEMARQFAVSRTVVREALSRLQAAGLVETRHGIGTFVRDLRDGENRRPGEIFRLHPADMAASDEVLAALELRVSLETECAGLAAARRSDEQLAVMRAAIEEIARNIDAGIDTIPPDFRFHREIARATGNHHFSAMLDHFGAGIIPRTRIVATPIPADQFADYLRRVNAEHEQILDAIERRDAESARAAMRVHLINSRERLRRAQGSD